MKQFHRLLVFVMLLALLISGVGVYAQDDTCTPALVARSFAEAATTGRLDAWEQQYANSDCPSSIKLGARALAAIYVLMGDVQEGPPLTATPPPTDCPPSSGLLCDVYLLANGNETAFPFGTVSAAYVDSCARSGTVGLQLTFDPTQGPFGGWGLHWDLVGHLDAGIYDTFVFWVKGDEGGEEFEIALKDLSNREPRVQSRDYVPVNASEWREVRLPLSLFTVESLDLSNIVNFSFGFNREHSPDAPITICIDDIYFE